MPHTETFDSPISNVTPVQIRVLASPQPRCRQPRRDGRLIRWGMHKSKYRHLHHIGLTGLVSGILLRRVSKRRSPGMTAKGIKWTWAQEEFSL
jgi:hypothetical protein